MDPNRIERLSPRQLKALQLYSERYSAKQIADMMGVSENTASGYLTEAAAIVDAGGRRGAAAALKAYEAAHPEQAGRIPVGDEPPPPGSPAVPPVEPSTTPPSMRTLFPLRQGAKHNDLSVVQRIAWIFFIAVGIAVGFGAVASAIRVVNDIVIADRSRQ